MVVMSDDPTRDLIRSIRLRRDLPSPERRREIRVAAGASRKQIAVVVGVAPESVWRWESGERTPDGENLKRYVALLKRLEKLGLPVR